MSHSPGLLEKENLISCQPRILQRDDFKSLCGNSTQHGNQQNNRFCTFLNETSKTLESACGNGNQSISLKEVSTSIDLLFYATAQQSNGSKEEVALVATIFLQSVESAALATARKSPGNKTQTITGETMTIVAQRVTDNCSRAGKMIELNAENELMSIDCMTVVGAREQGSGVIAFISYATLESILNNNFIDQQNLREDVKLGSTMLNSKVVSGTIGKPGPLSKPFNFTLEHKQKKEMEDKIICVFWNLTGPWFTEGCRLLRENSTHTTCTCNHLSSFAILMASHAIKESYPLTIITYVGLTLSLLCLFLAILTFLLCRSIRNISTSLHLQLCLCLFLADLLFLTTVNSVTNEVVCAVIAGLLHYLFLACFSWMLLEGLHLFLTVRNLKVVNYTSASQFKKRFVYPFGYGFPALVVAISAAVNPGGYGTSKHKLKPSLTVEENRELLGQCFKSLFPLPPLEKMKEEDGTAKDALHIQLLRKWFSSGKEWEREWALQASTQLQTAYQEVVHSTTQETFHQFGSLIGAVAPYSCDSLATSRQWVVDCISCLLCIQGQPMNLGSAEEELRCLREELTAAPDPEALFQASSKMARVVSEYFPPEQATAFIEATVESMLSASPTCATAAGLWMKVILKECGDAMPDKVPAIVDIIYSHMATIQEGSLRQFLLEAVSILAHHHLEAVISSLLSNHLPMDSDTSELWRSLGGEPLLATQVLQVLIEKIKTSTSQEGSITSETETDRHLAAAEPLSATCAIFEVVSALQSSKAVRELLPEWFPVLLQQVSRTSGQKMPLPRIRSRSLFQKDQQHTEGNPCW
ncbi:hypothetical protein KIL84_012378 [Mauremys mutica]|uniref:Uncharacterized protein n=1 Tax=Mauremys mutica TaxID=74926 RepID=A0A9D3XYR6_9SAUR|nr:hypothetical protein KIL84_012378 [Mauremys mutica]